MKSDKKRRTLELSFRDAFIGIWDCIKSERNMRIHITATAYLLFFAANMGLARGEFALLFLAVAAVITAETFNTAFEEICDFIKSDFDKVIGKIKDICAGAVLVSSIFAVCVGAVLMVRMEFFHVITMIFTTPLYAVLFVLSLILAVIFIIAGPMGMAGFLKPKANKQVKK